MTASISRVLPSPKCAVLPFELRHQRQLLDPLRPLEPHRAGAVRAGDGRGAVLQVLQRDVLGGVAAADDEQPLALELQRVAEIVGVQHPAGEAVDPREARHVRDREVTGGHDDVVELLVPVRLRVQVRRAHRELAARLGVRDVPHRGAEPDVLAHVGFLGAAEDVVVEDRVGREGRNGLAEVLFERVVPELQALLGPVRPQVPVHAAVHGLAVLVEARPPGVVPQAAPVGLPFEAHQLRNVRALALRLLEGAKLGKAAGARPDDGHTFVHRLLPVASS